MLPQNISNGLASVSQTDSPASLVHRLTSLRLGLLSSLRVTKHNLSLHSDYAKYSQARLACSQAHIAAARTRAACAAVHTLKASTYWLTLLRESAH